MCHLAADPRYTAITEVPEAGAFQWLMETSDFLPWTKDHRFPKVSLKSPGEEMMERLAKAGKYADGYIHGRGSWCPARNWTSCALRGPKETQPTFMVEQVPHVHSASTYFKADAKDLLLRGQDHHI